MALKTYSSVPETGSIFELHLCLKAQILIRTWKTQNKTTVQVPLVNSNLYINPCIVQDNLYVKIQYEKGHYREYWKKISFLTYLYVRFCSGLVKLSDCETRSSFRNTMEDKKGFCRGWEGRRCPHLSSKEGKAESFRLPPPEASVNICCLVLCTGQSSEQLPGLGWFS